MHLVLVWSTPMTSTAPPPTHTGKDVSIFVTKEDIEKPEMVTNLAEDDLYGVVLPNGELNWDCPCLGGMAHGTCGQEFKDAFSCFHYRWVVNKYFNITVD